jgi:ParB-like nuclease domain
MADALLHPVVVKPDGKLVAGERRLRAAKLLGWRHRAQPGRIGNDKENHRTCPVDRIRMSAVTAATQRQGQGRRTSRKV